MTKKIIFICTAIIAIWLIQTPVNAGNTKSSAATNPEITLKPLLSQKILQTAGINAQANDFVYMLVNGPDIYIACWDGNIVARFKGGKIDKIFKAGDKTGKEAILNARSMFLLNPTTLAIFDAGKPAISTFDLNLRFLNQFPITADYASMSSTIKGVTAFFLFPVKGFAAGLLDSNFNPAENLFSSNKPVQFDKFYKPLLNKFYTLNNKLVAHTYCFFPNKECKIDVYDVTDKKVTVSLTWQNPVTPEQKHFDETDNLYISQYVGKHGDYYVVQNLLFSTKKPVIDLWIFNSQGKTVANKIIPFSMIRYWKNNDDPRVFVVDKNGNIGVVSVTDLLK